MNVYLWTILANVIIAGVQLYSIGGVVPRAMLGFWIMVGLSTWANQFLSIPNLTMGIVSATGTFLSQMILGIFFAAVMNVRIRWKLPTLFYLLTIAVSVVISIVYDSPSFASIGIPLVVGGSAPFFFYSYWILKEKRRRFTPMQKIFFAIAILMSFHYLDWPFFRTRVDLIMLGFYIAFAFFHVLSIFIPMVGNENAWEIRNAHLEDEVKEKVRQYLASENMNRMKDEFLNTVSHELRTPLTAIVGYSELLLSHVLTSDKERQDAVEVIYQSAKVQTEIVEQLLDVSSIISGTIRIEPEWIDPLETLRSVVETARPMSSIKNIQVIEESPKDVPRIFVDPKRFRQILWNLLSNAIKFSQPGGKVKLIVKAEGGNLFVTVQDWGIGIEQDFLPFVFDRLRQEDPTMARQHGGLGLGLSIVKDLVELHGGKIEVESGGRDQGSRFTFFIPIPNA